MSKVDSLSWKHCTSTSCNIFVVVLNSYRKYLNVYNWKMYGANAASFVSIVAVSTLICWSSVLNVQSSYTLIVVLTTVYWKIFHIRKNW